MASTIEKLSFREKVGYGFGDAAANFVFQTMLIFQLGFYTDVFGISAVAAGTLLLVGRFWDAAFDPFMGVGSSGIAALKMQRRFLGFEKDAAYVAAAVSRLEHVGAGASTDSSQSQMMKAASATWP